MPAITERIIQRVGPRGAYFVTLPVDWLRGQKLSKGSKVLLSYGDQVTIVPVTTTK